MVFLPLVYTYIHALGEIFSDKFVCDRRVFGSGTCREKSRGNFQCRLTHIVAREFLSANTK